MGRRRPLPPPPPPPPRNPWAGRRPVTKLAPLIASSEWPHRLLHVRTLTSHVKEGHNVYNGVEAPAYNVLSYTWGYYKDRTATEQPLPIKGVDWPIPPIMKSHFTAATFRNAINLAAGGVNCRCEWLWVDVACIPQEHKQETKESARLRHQEIGRQVEIFQRAQEAFAWLSSLKVSSLVGKNGAGPIITIDSILSHLNQSRVIWRKPQPEAMRFLGWLDEAAQSFEMWMTPVLHHPWFKSLWTLQEMVLRPDACIVFDDGLLDLAGDEEDDPVICRPWNFSRIKTDIYAIHQILQNSYWDADSTMDDHVIQKRDWCFEILRQRLQRMADLQEDRGLNALRIEFPHTVYSIASKRRATLPKDRIYGIMQTYGITCSQFPPGIDVISQLHALEDEFGAKLVAKAPLLSQIFIHGSTVEGAQKPRRSWLITQHCKVDDHFWTRFTSHGDNWEVKDLFDSLKVVDGSLCDSIGQRPYLKFVGKAWPLVEFLEAAASAAKKEEIHKRLFFGPHKYGDADGYLGLMLDHHISASVLGSVVDYFGDVDSMSAAANMLNKHYRLQNPPRGDKTAQKDNAVLPPLRVALLGSGSPSNLPNVAYVGLVVAPVSMDGLMRTGVERASGPMIWERVGLMRWTEIYHIEEPEPHQQLPSLARFQCLIT